MVGAVLACALAGGVFAADDSAMLQALLDKGGEVRFPAGEFTIGRTLVVGSGTRLICEKGFKARLKDGANCAILANRDAKPEMARDITVEGGVWDGNNVHQDRAKYSEAGFTPPLRYGAKKYGQLIVFSGVQGLHLGGMTVKDPQGFSFMLTDVEGFSVTNITFDCNDRTENEDGVHINGFARHGVIRGIRGHTNDDLVALNSDEGDFRSDDCTIEDILIEDLDGGERGYTGVRLLSRHARVRDVTIRNVRGKFQFNVVSFTHWAGENYKPGMGHFDGIHIEDITATSSRKEGCGHGGLIWFQPGVQDVGTIAIRRLRREEGAECRNQVHTIDIGANTNIRELRLDNVSQKVPDGKPLIKRAPTATGRIVWGGLADDEYDHVIHPGAADGTGFWNERSKWFMYAPAFGFKRVEGANEYRFTVKDCAGKARIFTAAQPTESLACVWNEIPVGSVSVVCEGIGTGGVSVGRSGERTFWKAAGFREGAYPPAKRGYREAALGVYDYILGMKETQYLLDTGKLDLAYPINSYASKLCAALIRAMIHCAGREPARRERAMKVARLAAEYLIERSEPPDAPLAHFPPTYAGPGENNTGTRNAGKIMLIYPAEAAKSFVALAKATGERRYLEQAERIASTYLKLQGEDGTWYLKMETKSGNPTDPNRLVPIQSAVPMLEALFEATGKAEYRAAADRAFANVERTRLSTWNWEGQFEDITPTAMYQNLTKHDACTTAIYLGRRFPGDAVRIAQMRELLRFAEDQFVCWVPPCAGGNVEPYPGWAAKTYATWQTPCALEQYNCYQPIDSSAAKLIRTYLALYRAEGHAVDIAKAKALADTITRMQRKDGSLPTWWYYADGTGGCDWLNCMISSAEALEELAAAVESTEDFMRDWTFSRDGGEARTVDLPHDGAIGRDFDVARYGASCGGLPYWGHGEYGKTLVVTDAELAAGTDGWRLEFDGVMSFSAVYVNGRRMHEEPCGYASFTVPLAGCLKAGANEIRVALDPPQDSSRWYPGFGIYRDVRLVKAEADHLVPGSVALTFPSVTPEKATVKAVYEMSRGGRQEKTWVIENPHFWSPETPNLYEIALGDVKIRYGIRTLRYSPTDGFFLNGVHRQMRGVCLHHDLGVLGAEFNRDVARRQLSLLKEMGCDAIRTSHNFPAPALLDLCDELGLMVLDEAFDEWKAAKVKNGVASYWDEHERLVREFVRRDRNHPCVVMWSAGNELIEDAPELAAQGVAIGKELTALFHEEDPQERPVTAGHWMPVTITNGVGFATDVFGANYLPNHYAELKGVKGVVGTETCSAISSRGFYRPTGDLADKYAVTNLVNSYGYCVMHPNDYIPDVEFAAQDENPHVYGEFVWTGFDYLGEPSPWYTSRSSYFGIFDLCGFPKDAYWLYRSHWRPEIPTAHILPHWNWKDGDVLPVVVYTSGDEAELFVNGRSQGRRKRGAREYRLRWDGVAWEKGVVSVKVWKDGRPWAEDRIETSGAFAKFVFSDEVCGEFIFRTATAVDAEGRFVPDASEPVAYGIPAGYEVVGTCNGDAADVNSLRSKSVRSFFGKALVVFRRARKSEDRAETLAWFLRNEYGVRPAAAEKPDVSFERFSPDREVANGLAVRKRIRVNCRGPHGTNSFVFSAFIPKSGRPVPATLLLCNRAGVVSTNETVETAGEFWPYDEIVRRGYAAIAFYLSDLANETYVADTALRSGVFAAYERFEDRRPDSWGVLSAWAWGASRVMDWLVAEPSVDAARTMVIGHSRGGKAALVAGVTDERFAMVVSNDSGTGGARLNKMEVPESEPWTSFGHFGVTYWFCDNYRRTFEADNGMGAAHDQDEWLALVAPRILAVGSGADDKWAGPEGERAAAEKAAEMWKRMGVPGNIDYWMRPGGHGLTREDWGHYLDFADRRMGKK